MSKFTVFFLIFSIVACGVAYAEIYQVYDDIQRVYIPPIQKNYNDATATSTTTNDGVTTTTNAQVTNTSTINVNSRPTSVQPTSGITTNNIHGNTYTNSANTRISQPTKVNIDRQNYMPRR